MTTKKCMKMLLAVGGFCFLVGVTAAEETNNDTYQRILSGEVIVSTFDEGLPGGAARVTALFSSSSEPVWEIIGHCEYAFVYIKGLKECEVLEPGQSFMLLRHQIRNSWYTPTLKYTFSASRYGLSRGEAMLVEGNLKKFQGSWEMTPVDEGRATIVSHEIRVQPEFLSPRWLVRRSLKRDLPDMLACIRGLANASGTQVAKAADLKRCPGDAGSLSK